MAATYPLSIAPMMDWTDRHYRYFMRGMTRRTLLYTEMVTTGALLYGDKDRHLAFSPEELPLALQLGGDDPAALAVCAKLGESYGYTEINLNVGCPSNRVQNGNFGVCLMAQPERVMRSVAAMKEAVNVPITVKHRIGVDELDRYEDLAKFVEIVSKAGADRFTVHARKAWLNGLSPKENRTIPPLRYADVYLLKKDFPELEIELNGGVRTFDAAKAHLEHLDAVMIGRAAYETPYLFATADAAFYGAKAVPSYREVVMRMYPYIEAALKNDIYLMRITRHMLNLFKGQPGAKAWRRHLSEHGHKAGSGLAVVQAALEKLPSSVLDSRALIEEPEVSV